MKNGRITLIMTAAVLGGFAIIIMMNIAALFGVIPARYISPNDVRGMAIEHNRELYTLNFSQQNQLVDIFNRSIPISKEEFNKRSVSAKNRPEVDRIIIYRFNAPDIEIKPVGYLRKTHSVQATTESESLSFVFSVPDWNRNGFLEELAVDNVYELLSSTYDH